MIDKTDALVDLRNLLQEAVSVKPAELENAMDSLLEKHGFARDEVLPLTRELFAGLPGFD